MKKLEFETSKGRFLVSESDEHYDYRFIGLLSRITEEQASEIVGSIKELHSLLKSKGVHLFENPYKDCEDKDLEWLNNELTFYNPYIFKL